METRFEHGTLGPVIAVRSLPSALVSTGHWSVIQQRTGLVIGAIEDTRCEDGGEPSEVPSIGQEDSFLCFRRDGNVITRTVTLSGSLAAIAHSEAARRILAGEP